MSRNIQDRIARAIQRWYVRALARVGVDGYISKENSQEELAQVIREVFRGGAILTPRVASKLIRAMSKQPLHPPGNPHLPQADDLRLREIEGLELLHQGMRNESIAEYLAISPRTVESHVARIMAKMGATSRTEAVRTSIETGIIAG